MTKESQRGLLLWLMILLILACPIANQVKELRNLVDGTAKLQGTNFVGIGDKYKIKVLFEVGFTPPSTFNSITAIDTSSRTPITFTMNSNNELTITSLSSITTILEFNEIICIYNIADKITIKNDLSVFKVYPESAFPTMIIIPSSGSPPLDYDFEYEAKGDLTIPFDNEFNDDLLDSLKVESRNPCLIKKDVTPNQKSLIIICTFKSNEDYLYTFQFNEQKVFTKTGDSYSFKVKKPEIKGLQFVALIGADLKKIQFSSPIEFTTALCENDESNSMEITSLGNNKYYFNLLDSFKKNADLICILMIHDIKFVQIDGLIYCEKFDSCFAFEPALPTCTFNDIPLIIKLKTIATILKFDIKRINVKYLNPDTTLPDITLTLDANNQFTIPKELEDTIDFSFEDNDAKLEKKSITFNEGYTFDPNGIYSHKILEIDNMQCVMSVKINNNLMNIEYNTLKMTINFKEYLKFILFNQENKILFNDSIEKKTIIWKGFDDDVIWSLSIESCANDQCNVIIECSHEAFKLDKITEIILHNYESSLVPTNFFPDSKTDKPNHFQLIPNSRKIKLLKVSSLKELKLHQIIISSEIEKTLKNNNRIPFTVESFFPNFGLFSVVPKKIMINVKFFSASLATTYKDILSLKDSSVNYSLECKIKIDKELSCETSSTQFTPGELQFCLSKDSTKCIESYYTIYQIDNISPACHTIKKVDTPQEKEVTFTIIEGKTEIFTFQEFVPTQTVNNDNLIIKWKVTSEIDYTLTPINVMLNKIPQNVFVLYLDSQIYYEKTISEVTLFPVYDFQTMLISFSTKILKDSIKELTIEKTGITPETLGTVDFSKCTPKSIENIIWECTLVKLDQTKMKATQITNYCISYTDICDAQQSKITKTFYDNQYLSSLPTKIQMSGTEEEVKVTFRQSYKKQPLYLSNKDNTPATLILVQPDSQTIDTNNAAVVIITGLNNLAGINEGWHWFVTNVSKTRTGNGHIHFFKNQLTLKTNKYSLKLSEDLKIVLINPIYKNRIKVEMKKGVDTWETILFDLTVLTEIKIIQDYFTEVKKEEIRITDLVPYPNEYRFVSVEVYESTSGIDFVSPLIIMDHTDHKIFLKFDDPITNRNVYYYLSIPGKASQQYRLLQNLDNKDQVDQLEFNHPTGVTSKEPKLETKIDLLDQEGNIIITVDPVNEYLTIFKKNIPVEIDKQKSEFVIDTTGKYSFIVDFPTGIIMYSQYKNLFVIKTSENKECTIESINLPANLKPNTLSVSCPFTENDSRVVTIDFKPKPFDTLAKKTLTVYCPKISEFDDQIYKGGCVECPLLKFANVEKNECQTCLDKDATKPLWDNEVCVATCPSTSIYNFDNKACSPTCELPHIKNDGVTPKTCTPLEILSIDGILQLDDEKQSFTITLKTPPIDDSSNPIAMEFFIQKEWKDPIDLTCAAYPAIPTKFQCTKVSTIVTSSGWKVYWKLPSSDGTDFTEFDQKGMIINSSISIINSISLNAYKKKITPEIKVITTLEIYETQLYLFNADKDKAMTTLVKVTDFTVENTSVKLKVDSLNILDEGYYYVSFNSDKLMIDPKTAKGFYIYETTIEYQSSILSKLLQTVAEVFEVPFINDIFLSRFKSITLIKNGETPGQSILIKDCQIGNMKNILVLPKKIFFDVETKYQLVIADNIETTVLPMVIQVYADFKFKKLGLNLIIIDLPLSTTDYIEFEEGIKNPSAIEGFVAQKSDQASKSFTFRFETNLTPPVTQMKFKYLQDISNIFGVFNRLMFKAPGGRNLKFEDLDEFLILKKNLLPKTLKDPLSLPSVPSEYDFIITFNSEEVDVNNIPNQAELYAEYNQYFKVSHVNYEDIYPCTAIIDSPLKALKVKCASFDYNLSKIDIRIEFFYFTDGKIEAEVKCPRGQAFYANENNQRVCQNCYLKNAEWLENQYSYQCVSCTNTFQELSPKTIDGQCKTCISTAYFNLVKEECMTNKICPEENGVKTYPYMEKACALCESPHALVGDKCQWLQIKNIKGYLIYDQLDQYLKIEMNLELDNSVIIEFRTNEGIALECTKDADTSSFFTCLKIERTFTYILPTKEIIWEIPNENNPSKWDSIGFNVFVSTNSIVEVIPEKMMILSPTMFEPFTIEFLNNRISNEKLYVFNLDVGGEQKTIKNTAESTYYVVNDKQVTVSKNIWSTFMRQQGHYIISLDLEAQAQQFITGQGIYFCSSILGFYKDIEYISQMLNLQLVDFDVYFKKYIFLSRFKSITLKKGNAAPEKLVNYELKRVGTESTNILTIKQISFKEELQYELSFEDIMEDNTITKIIQVYDDYQPEKWNSIILLKKSTSPLIPDDIIVHFKKPIKNKTIIKQVLAEKDSLSFIFKLDPTYNKPETIQSIRLLLDQNQSPRPAYGEFTTLKFLDKINEELFKTSVPTTFDYIIILDNHFPQSILNTEVTFNNEMSFEIHFNSEVEVIYKQFLDLLEIKEKGQTKKCGLVISADKKFIIVTCEFVGLTVPLTASLTFKGHSVTIAKDITIKCKAETQYQDGVCKPCKDLQSQWIVDKCVKCSEQYKLFKIDKCETCTTTNGGEFYDVATSTCITSCPNYIYVNKKVCFTQCPDNLLIEEINGQKTCVEKCSDGYGSKDKKCIPIKIEEIKGKLVADFSNQIFEVVMNCDINGLSFNMLNQDIPNPTIIYPVCTKQPDPNGNVFSCVITNIPIENAKYKIFWFISPLVHDLEGTIIVASKFIDSISPTDYNIGTTPETKDLIVTFARDYDPTWKLYFLNVDKKGTDDKYTNHEITSAYITPVDNSKTKIKIINFASLVSSVEGFYMLTDDINDNISTAKTSIGVYAYKTKVIALSPNEKSIKIATPITNTVIHAIFNADIFKSRFSKIIQKTTLVPDGKEIQSKGISTTDSKALILDPADFPNQEKYTVVIEPFDSTVASPIKYIMTYQLYEDYLPDLLNQNVIIIDSTIRTITLTFTKPIINFDVIKKIVSANNVEFSFVLLGTDTTKKTMTLTPKQGQTGITFGRVATIDFLDQANESLFKYSKPLIIINKAELPLAVENKNIKFINDILVPANDMTFEIKFTGGKKIYDEYKGEIYIKTDNGKACEIISIKTEASVIAKCDFKDTLTRKVSLNFFNEKDYTTPTELIELSCEKGEWDSINFKCKSCNSQFGEWDDAKSVCIICATTNKILNTVTGKCEACPQYQKPDKNVCKYCSAITPNTYIDDTTLECKADCAPKFIWKDIACIPCTDNYIQEKKCIEQCEDGYGIEKPTEASTVKKCLPITIENVEGSIRLNILEGHSLTITMNTKTSSALKFEIRVKGQPSSNPFNYIECTSTDEYVTFTCPKITTVLTLGKQYEIFWRQNAVISTIGKEVLVTEFTFEKFDPSIYQIGQTTPAILKFTGSVGDNYLIDLINIDTNENVSEEPTKKETEIQFELPTKEGFYCVRTRDTNDSNKPIIYPACFILYKDAIDFYPNSVSGIEQNFKATILYLKLTSTSFKMRFNLLELYAPENPTTPLFTINDYVVEGDIFKITKEITFDQLGTYTFKVKDLARPGTVLTYSIEIIAGDNPTTVSYEQVYYYTPTTPSFLVTFNKPVVCPTKFSSVKTKGKVIEFTIAYPTGVTAPSLTCSLSLKNPTDASNWGSFPTILFYHKLLTDSIVVGSTELSIAIVNSNTIPSTLVKAMIPIMNLEETFLVEFKQPVYPQYFIPGKEKMKPHPDDIRIKSLAYKDNQLEVTLKNPITQSSPFNSVQITSFDKDITIMLKIIKCIPPEIQDPVSRKCMTCKQANVNFPYYYATTCLGRCPYGTVEDATKLECFNTCGEFNSAQNAYYIDVSTRTCVTDCDASKYKHEDTKKCYDKCPTLYNNTPLYSATISDKLKCVPACPTDHKSDASNVCKKYTAGQVCLNEDKDVICIESCPPGTEVLNNRCRLLGSTTTSTKPLDCTNYCKNGSCITTNNKRECQCTGNYKGLRCDVQTETEILNTITDTIALLIQRANNYVIDINDAEATSMTLNINSIIKADPNYLTKYLQNSSNRNSNEQSIQELIIVTGLTLQSGNTYLEEYLPLVSLTLKSSLELLKKYDSATPSRLRNLSQHDDLHKTITKFAGVDMTVLLDLSAQQVTKNDIKIIKDDTYNLMTITLWTNNQDSQNKFKQQVANSNAASIVNTEYMKDHYIKEYTYAKMELATEYTELMTKKKDVGPTIQVKYYDTKGEDIMMVTNPDATVKYKTQFSVELPALATSEIIDRYLYFIDRGIDILNPKDPVFTTTCYYNKALEFDLPQEYRFKELFAGIEYSMNEECDFVNFDNSTNQMILSCPIETQQLQYGIQKSTAVIDTGIVSNLAIMCQDEVDEVKIRKNCGCWISLGVGILGLIAFIVLCMTTYNNTSQESLEKWIQNDQIKTEYFVNKDTDYSGINDDNEEYKPEIGVKLSLCTRICRNFRACHPLATLFCPSIVSPLFLKIAIFVFNVFNQFGFNAVFYTEAMMYRKMGDSFRDNFAYPMKAEFEKIVYTLLVSMGLTMVIRMIVCVSVVDKNALFDAVINCNSAEEKMSICKTFWWKGIWRRVIAYVLMLCLMSFLYYYMVVFCGVYVITQYSWAYSGVWTLMMNWFLFAPFSIILLSIIENCNSICVDYVKQLFWF